jgi:hypothetical protein
MDRVTDYGNEKGKGVIEPYYDHGGITIYHGDCREILPTLPAASVDLLLTDPPYGGDLAVDFAERFKSKACLFGKVSRCLFGKVICVTGHTAGW